MAEILFNHKLNGPRPALSPAPAHDTRPRERLLASGPGALTDPELIAILLRTGSRGEPVLALAEDLLACQGGLRGLMATPAERLMGRRGLSGAKTATLLAAGELARRWLRAPALQKSVSAPAAAAPHLLPLFAGLERECFGALYLDAKHRPLAAELLFQGGASEAAVYPAEIARRALRHGARALLLAHNHPSGDLAPSAEDLALTRRIESALLLLDIRCLDHLIVSGDQWRALRMNGGWGVQSIGSGESGVGPGRDGNGGHAP
jgi:DNA repair protein RadC